MESAETGRGIPDIYTRNHATERWFELKNAPRLSIYESAWKIDWRAGQQAWHYEYYKATNEEKFVYTLVAVKDGFIRIPMCKRYKNNIVLDIDVSTYKTLKYLVEAISI
jgi:hypothetical protein